MSFLLKKSEQNKAALSYLIEVGCYSSAVHCGYYCCIQKIIHILKDYYTEEYNAGLAAMKGGHGNRHKFYIQEIAARFSKDRREQRKLKDLLLELRDFRIESDYSDEEITESKAKKVKSQVEEIQLLIKRNLTI